MPNRPPRHPAPHNGVPSLGHAPIILDNPVHTRALEGALETLGRHFPVVIISVVNGEGKVRQVANGPTPHDVDLLNDMAYKRLCRRLARDLAGPAQKEEMPAPESAQASQAATDAPPVDDGKVEKFPGQAEPPPPSPLPPTGA